MNDATLEYRKLGDEHEAGDLCRILSLAFGGSVDDARAWLERDGLENVRVVMHDGRVAAGLTCIPMAQYFGGQSVPMVGIAGVATDPGVRAVGAGTTVMREVVRELRRDGWALSTLYPAKQAPYRRAGYELAGCHFRISVDTRHLASTDRTISLRRMEDADRPEMERLQAERGRENDGNLDRNAAMWSRIWTPLKSEPHGFVVEDEGGLQGYVVYVSKQNARWHQDLIVLDMVVRSPAAARRMLAFFRDHRTLVDSVSWRGSPQDPLLLQAEDQGHDVRLDGTWMLRIVDVEKALEARGYRPGTEAEIHLEVLDDVCPENEGRYVFRVANSEGKVEAGGEGRVKLDVRTLAALYSGFLSPEQARVGLGMEASAEDAAALASVFAGPMPWMQDGF